MTLVIDTPISIYEFEIAQHAQVQINYVAKGVKVAASTIKLKLTCRVVKKRNLQENLPDLCYKRGSRMF